MAHDLARTGSRYGPRCDKRNQRYVHIEVNLEGGNTITPDQAGRLLHHGLDILRVVVLPAENNHVLDAAADKEFALVQETHAPGAEGAVVIGAVVHQAGVKQLQRQFRIIPEPRALALSRNPNLTDSARLQSEVLLRIHDL